MKSNVALTKIFELSRILTLFRYYSHAYNLAFLKLMFYILRNLKCPLRQSAGDRDEI